VVILDTTGVVIVGLLKMLIAYVLLLLCSTIAAQKGKDYIIV